MAVAATIIVKLKDLASKGLKAGLGPAIAGIGLAAGLAATQVARKLGRALNDISKQVVDIGSTFQQSMQNVKAISGATGKEFDKLRDKARSLGATFSLAGFSVAETLAATGDTLSLAAAGTLEMAEAADITSAIIRTFNKDASETGQVVDVLAKAATTSNQTVRDIGEAMKFAGVTSAQLGVSLEETAALLGKLADRGLKGSIAGTALRRSFAVFLGQLEPGEEGLRDFDAALAQNEDGSFNFSKALEQLSASGITANEVMKAFGQRAGPGMLALLGVGREEIQAYTRSLENAGGTAERVAREKLDTLKGKTTLLTSALSETALIIFDEVSPALELLVELLTKVVQAFNQVASKGGPLNEMFLQQEIRAAELAFKYAMVAEGAVKLAKAMAAAGSLVPGFLGGEVSKAAFEILEEVDDAIDDFEAKIGKGIGQNILDAAKGRLKRGTGEEDEGPGIPGEVQGPPEAASPFFSLEEEEKKREAVLDTQELVLASRAKLLEDSKQKHDAELQLLEFRFNRELIALEGNEEAQRLLAENFRNESQAIEDEFLSERLEKAQEIEEKKRQQVLDTQEAILQARIAAEEDLIEREQLELELLDLHLLAKLELVQDNEEALTLLTEESEAKRAAIRAKFRKEEEKKEKKKGKDETRQKEETAAASFKVAKEAFGKNKAIAIAEAIVALSLSMIRAQAHPPGPPTSFSFVAAAIATGATILAALKGSKFAEGGVVTGGTPGVDSVPALLTPGEVVLTREQQGVVAEALSRPLELPQEMQGGFRSGEEGQGPGGARTIAFNFDIRGGEADPGDVPPDIQELAERINVLVKEQGLMSIATHVLINGVPVSGNRL
jgi:TP901 family phage tail tape measure protein